MLHGGGWRFVLRAPKSYRIEMTIHSPCTALSTSLLRLQRYQVRVQCYRQVMPSTTTGATSCGGTEFFSFPTPQVP